MDGKAIPPGEGDDPLVHSGDKRHRRDLINEESDRENNDSEIRRTSSLGALVKDETEEPCTKIARRPHAAPASWPTGIYPPKAPAKIDSTPSVDDAVQTLMSDELDHNRNSASAVSRSALSVSVPKRIPALAFAPTLKDYIASGGEKYLPRPEWVTARAANEKLHQIDPSSSANRIIATESIETYSRRFMEHGPQHRDHATRNNDNNNEHDETDEGTLPNNGLLPEGDWAAFSSPTRHRRDQQEQREIGDERTETRAISAESAVARDNSTTASAATVRAANVNGAEGDEMPSLELIAGKQQNNYRNDRPATFGKDFDTALHVAVKENSTKAALDLINKGAAVDVENGKGATPLILASQKGNCQVVAALLDKDASPHAASQTGCTSLLQAAHFGHIEAVKVLLKHNARIEMANYKNTTPLMRAAQEGHLEIVDLLLRHGAFVNRRNNEQMSALMLASQRGHSHIVKRMIKAYAEIDAMTVQESTSLMLACKRGHLDAAKVLVTSGCELMLRDSRGRTARAMAKRKNAKELLELLKPTMQIELMRRESRTQRNHVMAQMWALLQQERATVVVDGGDVSIHHVSDNPNSNLLRQLPSSQNMLVQAMTLPAPLLENIAAYLPLPYMWNKRIGMITKRCRIDVDSSVSCALDLIDEVLEEGGFVEACDEAKVTPPPNFSDWVS